MFSQKPLVTLQMVKAATRDNRGSLVLNSTFAEELKESRQLIVERSKSISFQSTRASVIDFCNAFGLPKEKALKNGSIEADVPIEKLLVQEGLEHYSSENISEEEFVEREFSKFMPKPGYYEMNQKIDKLEVISRKIEKNLNDNCFKHYSTIAKGLLNIQTLNDDNIVSLVKIRVTRNIIASLKKEFCSKSIQAVHLKRQSNNLKESLSKIEMIANTVGIRFKILREIEIDEYHFQFLKCHNIAQAMKEIAEIVGKQDNGLEIIKALNNFDKYIANKKVIVHLIVEKNWMLLHQNYNEKSFFNNLMSQFYLENKGEIDPLEKIKSKQLTLIADSIIDQCLKLSPNDHNQVGTRLDYMKKETFLEFLAELFDKFSKLMANYHLISRWYVKFDPSESTNFLQTDWNENILSEELLDCNKQKEMFLEYIESNKNIYLSGRKELWKMIEDKVCLIISNAHQIDTFSQDELIVFLRLTSSFIGTGVTYSNTLSEHIRQSVNGRIKSYYQQVVNNLLASLQQSICNETWEQAYFANLSKIFQDLRSVVDIPLDKEFINSIQYILPELKVESIESYSPQNHSKYLSMASPSLFKEDNQPESPTLKTSHSSISENQPRRMDFKLQKVEEK